MNGGKTRSIFSKSPGGIYLLEYRFHTSWWISERVKQVCSSESTLNFFCTALQ